MLTQLRRSMFHSTSTILKRSFTAGTRSVRSSTVPREYFVFRQRNQSLSWLKFGGVSAALFGTYYVYHLETVPYTGRSHMVDITRKTELKMGENAFQGVLKQYRGKILHPDHPLSVRVRKVGERIARAAALQDCNWEFVVVDSPQVNAFCLPGGKIVFFTGLLKRLQSDEQFIAAVMGHEVAHAVAQYMQRAHGLLPGHGAEQLGIPLSSQVMRYAIQLPKSRSMELEADYIGLLLMAKACYDPRVSLEVEHRISAGSKAPPEYLSTHPNMESRIRQMQGKLNEAVGIYNQCEFHGTFQERFKWT